ncbi:MAG: Rossmann-like and DUF2520 domain-containing protein [Microbacteriaceae bacterium]
MVEAGRLGVGVIGAGRVGPVLAAALAGAGHAIVGINAHSDESRERVEAMLPGVPLLDVPELVERSELVVIAVPEDQLEALVSGLSAIGAWQPGQIVLHTSARFGSNVLTPAVQQGAIPVALHPALAFTGTSMDVARLTGSYMAVTAPNAVLPIGQALAVEMGGEPIVVAEADRVAYAEAIDTASSFSTAIVDQAVGLLAEIGIAAPGRVLAPLVRSSVDNALRRSSGPDLDLDAVAEALDER